MTSSLRNKYDPMNGLNIFPWNSPFEEVIPPGGIVRINTGFGLEFPRGTYGSIRDRSSYAVREIIVLGGIIDEVYFRFTFYISAITR